MGDRSAKSSENKGILSTWTDAEYWGSLCPSLSISAEGIPSTEAKPSPIQDESERRKNRLIEDGYALVDDITADQNLTKKLAEAITKLHKEHSLPATFVLLYAETWKMAQCANEILSSCTHLSNKFNFDMLAWYIDPREGVAGFSPHRDRQPHDAKSSFHNNGMAKYVTMWTALTPATPENSCLYVIPKQYDPGYTEGDDDGDDEESDPLSRCLPNKQAYQNIRALPRNTGQSLLFTHRILHWGSRGNEKTQDQPRIAISFVSSDPTFEAPYLASSWDDFSIPPFNVRLLLVCAQLLIYYQRFSLSKDIIMACHEYVKAHEDRLNEAYRRKVHLEFIKAMKEEILVAEGASAKEKDVGNSDEEDEAVLEAMLDAEAGGYGEFEDNFDETEHVGADGCEDDKDIEDQDDDEPGILFGKRDTSDNSGTDEDIPSKKAKTNID